MTVWAFACKNESSLNRWFDGTDQDVYLIDWLERDWTAHKGDEIFFTDSERKNLLKIISPVHVAIGAQLLNTAMLNGYIRRISDYTDAVVMEDEIDIRLSRTIVHLKDRIFLVEYFDKNFSTQAKDQIRIYDDNFITDDQDGEFPDGQAVDTALLSEVFERSLSKKIHDTVADSFGFTETFKASVGGKTFRNSFDFKELVEKNIENMVGDEDIANPLNFKPINSFMLNAPSDRATIMTRIEFVEDLQITLT